MKIVPIVNLIFHKYEATATADTAAEIAID